MAPVESLYRSHLDGAIAALDSLRDLVQSIGDSAATASELARLRGLYISARLEYKAAEPVLAYFERETAKYLNGPNLVRIEEEDATNIRTISPTGFQVMEEQLFDTQAEDLAPLVDALRLTRNRLRLLRAHTDLKPYREVHFLWLVREAVLRVAFLGLTGFDSPVLENALPEARRVYASLREMLAQGFSSRFSGGQESPLYHAWMSEFDAADTLLAGGPEAFATFDRYAFLRGPLHRQIDLWNQTVTDWNIEFTIESALRNRFSSPFSAEAFNLAAFGDPSAPSFSQARADLGRTLFHDGRLSRPGLGMSCATCHVEASGFADHRMTAPGLTRNTPTVAYAGLQRDFFFDGRAGSLEGQIVAVVQGRDEFHTDLATMARAVGSDSLYQRRFRALYGDTVTEAGVRNALAHFVRSLMPFASTFDKAMRGEGELSPAAARGFNLFAGKAKCATCHFPPVFNGTAPPDFSDSEFEHLGVPSDSGGKHLSPDPGRFLYLGAEARRHFFKTPTVRNAAKTAPYMHNGAYATLRQVIDFYARGGGLGLGLTDPGAAQQTLPKDSLDLSSAERADLLAFLESLSD